MRGQTERFLVHISRHRVMRESGNVPSVPLLPLLPLASAPFLREEVSICCHFDFPYEFSLAKRPARVSTLANRTQVSAGVDFRSIIGPRLHCPSVAESFHGQP